MTSIEFENVGKQYRLGLVSTQTLSHDLHRWWTVNVRGKEDPYLRIGETNDRSVKGSSDYVWALRDINFKVEQGDVVGIIGRNGAGKSTLLKLLSKVTAPTTGCIRARGRIGSLLEVGTGFHPEMTGRENIYMNGAILGMTKPEITRKLDEIVDFSGCERYLDTPVKRYSSGMMVRLGFAVAAHLDPEILVVDEVLAVGDAEFQKKAIGKMKDVSQGEGRTVLFVSHNMAAVRNLCTKGIVLNNGQIYHNGTVESALDTYLGMNTINVQDVSVSELPRMKGCSNKYRVIDIEYVDRNGNKTIPRTGSFLSIRFTVEAYEDCDKCQISFGIYNLNESILATFPTYTIMDEFKLKKGVHQLSCNIEKLPFTVGSYRLGYWAGESNYPSDVLTGLIYPMDVEDDDFYGFGRHVSESVLGKVVLCDYSWTI